MDSNLLAAVISGGLVNTSVLLWLAWQWTKVQTKLAVMETRLEYITEELDYLNGIAERNPAQRKVEHERIANRNYHQ